jgi:ABC-type uncharacterized transport system substrate-binding protein
LIAEYARTVGFTVVSEPLRNPVVEDEFRRVFAAFKEEKIEMIIVPDVPENNNHQKLIVDLANENEIATITTTAQFVKLGALMSYGPDLADLVRRAAGYVARILRGEYPGVAVLSTHHILPHDQLANRKSSRVDCATSIACQRSRGD